MEKFVSEHPGHDYIEVKAYSEEGIKRGMSMQVMVVPTITINDKISIVGWPFEEKDLIEHTEKTS